MYSEITKWYSAQRLSLGSRCLFSLSLLKTSILYRIKQHLTYVIIIHIRNFFSAVFLCYPQPSASPHVVYLRFITGSQTLITFPHIIKLNFSQKQQLVNLPASLPSLPPRSHSLLYSLRGSTLVRFMALSRISKVKVVTDATHTLS